MIGMKSLQSAMYATALTAIAVTSACGVAPPTQAPAPTPSATTAVIQTVTPTGTPASVATPVVTALTPAILRNAEYQSDAAGKRVKLTNGTYQDPGTPRAGFIVRVTMPEPYALGDISGDGVPDAAVILVTNTGGTGSFVELAAVLNEAGTPRHVTSAALGDRVVVKSVAIQEQQISVQLTAQGPDDPLCCPTQEVTRSFRLRGNVLEPQ